MTKERNRVATEDTSARQRASGCGGNRKISSSREIISLLITQFFFLDYLIVSFHLARAGENRTRISKSHESFNDARFFFSPRADRADRAEFRAAISRWKLSADNHDSADSSRKLSNHLFLLPDDSGWREIGNVVNLIRHSRIKLVARAFRGACTRAIVSSAT